ncbi:MAG: pyridoxal phosphate-dependent aminotransferase [Ruminococcaceae bacterium]|nr:pyridoxal phosphate-dependent aminotransferase [Oscillospiraceae bacterium]
MGLTISNKAAGISPSPTLAIDSKFKMMKQEGIDVVGFGAGEPDFDTPKHIKDAAIKAIMDGATKYTPASGTVEIKKAVVNKLKEENGLSYDILEIVVSNGAKHSLVNAFMAILNPEDEVIIPTPFWVSYPEMVKLADGKPVFVETYEENNFKFSISDLEKVLTEKTKALVLNNPSNPTGMLYTKEELKEIADFAIKNNIYVISDEIYEALVYDGKESYVSIASFNDQIKDLTIIVNGVSKTYAMTGWRIGYTASNIKIAKAMSNIQSHATSNPNSIAQVAATAALNGPKDEMLKMKEAFSKRRNHLVDLINNIDGVSCIKPDGAFYVMMNISSLFGKTYNDTVIDNVDTLCELLLSEVKLALVPGTGFGAPNYVRWSYATSMDNINEGIKRLSLFIDNLK